MSLHSNDLPMKPSGFINKMYITENLLFPKMVLKIVTVTPGFVLNLLHKFSNVKGCEWGKLV